ncbi:MAG TPA: hypothetical protein VMZ90_03865 [Vicinamibacterales bacterium]|nr:hypothetical protein [Vicinamibacterales bacterium]
MSEEQPTCGKGLAQNATLPWKLGELAGAMGGVLDTHIPSLDLTDENSRKEHDVYQRLASELRQAAAQLEAIARQMSAASDLPMGRHDMAMMGSEAVQRSFELFVQSERDMLTMLQVKLEEDQKMLAMMRAPR